jgi:hypothetical protein
MEHFVGLAVSQELTHRCVISSDGKTVWQGKCSSTPEDISYGGNCVEGTGSSLLPGGGASAAGESG